MKGISKPAGLKKPNMKRGSVAPEKTANLDTIVENIVVEEVQEEQDEVVQELAKPVETEIIQNDVVEEEIIAEESAPEEVIEEVVEEEKPKKKSSSRKKSSNKKTKEVKEEIEEVAPIDKENYKAKPLVDAMKSMIGITGCTTPEWEETKADIIEKIEGMNIDPDSTPAEMRYLIADIDLALSQLKIQKVNADQQFNPLLKHINYVSLQAGSKGSNSEERKANAIRGLIEYKSNPDDTEYTNLLDIQVYAENQIAFYDEMIKILQDKKNMLITFSGIVKTETQLGSY